MKLELLSVSQCYESETNPRGTDFAGKAFDELVASIREKGVLLPVLARPRKKSGKLQFEVVAGNRRLRAAKEAGLTEIPAQVEEMTDDQAREAQIVENLQRQDIHPLEEGQAYRQLIEDRQFAIKEIAARVAKSETYVRDRLFLTNLTEAVGNAFRKGTVTMLQAALIARLTPAEQKQALEYVRDAERYGDKVAPEDLKRWITEKFYQPLAYQPWLNDAEIAKLVGPCKYCPPNRPSLFGAVKEGQCTDLRCWGNKMAAYIKWRLDDDEGLVMVSKAYGAPNMKGAISKSDYTGLSIRKKDHCDFAEQGIVVEGADIGTTVWLCRSTACKQHHADHSDRGYATSPKEREMRKKERERDEAKREKFDASIAAALEEVKWPLSEKHLDALLDLMFDNRGTSLQMPIVKRHGLKPDKKKGSYGVVRDYAAPLRRLAEDAGKDGKLRMIFEFLLPTYFSHADSSELNKRISKL